MTTTTEIESTALAQPELTQAQPEVTLAELVVSAQDGDRAAFGELFTRCERAVYNTALRRLRDHGEAQELCQEVFVQALQKIGQLRVPQAFAGWIMQITHRMAINRAVRRRPPIATDPEMLEAVCHETDTPLIKALATERRYQVHQGLGRLGDMDRDTLVAFYVKGRSIVEMSDDFESPVGTIKRRLHVARKRLKKELEEMVAV